MLFHFTLSVMAADDLQTLNVLTGLDDEAVARKRVKEPGSLEQTEADKQIVQQLVSHILNSGNAATEQPSAGMISGAPSASMVPVSGLDIGALISLTPGNVMAVPVPPSGTYFQYQQGLAPLAAAQQASGTSPSKAVSVGPVASLSTDTKVTMATKPVPQIQSPQLVNPNKTAVQHLLNTAPGQVLLGSGGSSQANMVLTATGQHQQAPIVLTSQTQVIRTANGQTAILLNAPTASPQGIAQMPGPGALGGAVQIQSLSAGALTGTPVQANLGNVITIPLSSLASTLKLSGIPFQPVVQLPKVTNEVNTAEAAALPLMGQGETPVVHGDMSKEVEGVEDKTGSDQQQTHSLMEMLQDESQLQGIIAPLSSKDAAGTSVPRATTTTSQVSPTSVSNVVYTTTTPQPTILSPSTQMEMSGKASHRGFAASRKRPLEVEDTMDSDIEAFVHRFKQHRAKLNYTQIDVGKQLAEKYGHGLSQTTICRFESSMLSPQNMRKIMEWLEKWMAEATCKYTNGEASSSKKSRKRRTTLNPTIKASLEEHFVSQPKPGSQELSTVADKLGLEYEVVRVWFCNRRQKIRRESSNLHESSSELVVDSKHETATD